MPALDPRAVLRGLVLEDGRHWGEVAVDWQQADADAVLDLTGPRQHFQTRPRGGSKTTDLAAVALSVLLTQAPPASRSYVVAVDAEQAAILLDAMAGFISRTPALKDHLVQRARMVTNMASHASIEVLPADAASAWGLKPWLTVVDELAAWPSTKGHRSLWEAVVSGVPKAYPPATGRLVCLTSAGDPAHWSYRVLEYARSAPAWRVSEVAGPLPWRTEAELVEQRALLTGSAYARLHENVWSSPEDRLTTRADVVACVRHEGVLPAEPRVRYVVALDLGTVNDATVCVVAHVRRREGDGSAEVVVDRLDVWQGSKGRPVPLADVEEHIAVTAPVYNGAEVVFDPWQAVQLAQGLRKRGIRCREFTFSSTSTGRLGLTLYRLLRDHLLDLPNDEVMIEELSSVQLRETVPGNYRLDHDSGKHDDRAVAIALASHALLESLSRRRRQIVASGGVDEDTWRSV